MAVTTPPGCIGAAARCALTTPQVAACRAQTPLASADNARTARLGADVTLPGVSPGTVGAGPARASRKVPAFAGGADVPGPSVRRARWWLLRRRLRRVER
jgi:hypothetical protein